MASEQTRLRLAALLDIQTYGCPSGCAVNHTLNCLEIKKDCPLHAVVIEQYRESKGL